MTIDISDANKSAEELQNDIEKLTEQNRKLIEYMKYLITAMSAATVLTNNLYQQFAWYNEFIGKVNLADTQKEMLNFLEEEFGIQYKVLGEKDATEK